MTERHSQLPPDLLYMLCCAYLRGWYHGLDRQKDADGAVSDAAKVPVAEELCGQFPKIVRAVNSHAELVEALKKIANDAQMDAATNEYTLAEGCFKSLAAEARAALRKAGEL
jgi:hypothetical protein